MAIGPYRVYDPNNYIRGELKAIRGYIIPPSNEIPYEDLNTNIVATGEVNELLWKYEHIMMVDRELRRTNLDFKGFCIDVPYPHCLRRMVEQYVEIMVRCQQSQ